MKWKLPIYPGSTYLFLYLSTYSLESHFKLILGFQARFTSPGKKDYVLTVIFNVQTYIIQTTNFPLSFISIIFVC